MDGTLYMWAGKQDEIPRGHNSEEKMRRLSNIDTFTKSTGLWKKRVTEGVPPLGYYGYSSASIGNNLCFFGGYCGHHPIAGLCNGFHNSLNMLNINSLHWQEVSPTTDNNNVMRRASGGMIFFNEELLLVIGGGGKDPTTPHHDATYKYDDDDDTITNECNMFNTTTSKYVS